MNPLVKTAAVYAAILYAVSALNYIPGLTDDEGRTFGVFALDIYDDALHFASATWALVSAWLGKRASKTFLTLFGALYLGDGLLGLATGSGYLDLGIFTYGIQDYGLMFKTMANLPHIALGGIAIAAAYAFRASGQKVAA